MIAALGEPAVEELFDPERDGHGAPASSLPLEVEQHPAVVAQLQMPHLEADQLVAAQPAGDQQRQHGPVANA